MDYDDLKDLNKEYAEITKRMGEEFYKLFKKYLTKHPRLTVVNAIHLPLNTVMNLIVQDKKNTLPKLMPDLPDVFNRFLMPFSIIGDKWGKISGDEFCKAYREEYEKNFDRHVGWSDEQRDAFKEWFEAKIDVKPTKVGETPSN
jgi:hypothetical protein